MAEFLQTVRQLREAAARFYRVDFHIHSPASPDWDNSATKQYSSNPLLDKVSDSLNVSDATIEAYCRRCAASKRDIAIITDHMKFGFASKAASATDSNIVVLPGIELSMKLDQPLIKDYRIHILAVFPPGTDTGSVERLFPKGSVGEAQRTGKEEFDYKNLEDILKKIEDENGISIAAHIYSSKGIRCVYTKSAELILEPLSPEENEESIKKLGDQIKNELRKFDCLQVRTSTQPVHFLDEHGDLRIPLVVGSDCHSSADLGVEALRNVTYVKMSRPDFTSLKEALNFPDTRIRFFQNLPQSKPPRLLGLRLFSKKAHENTFFKDTVFGFSDNLTCIIGPRGSGKSAAIDAIRYLMGYNRALDEVAKVKDQVIDRQKHTLQETSIELLYERADGIIHRLQTTYDPKETYGTKVYDLDGNLLSIEDVEKSQDYPLKLYGWNELELLAEDPQTQRELLDRFISELVDLKTKKQEILSRLADNRQECLSQAKVLDTYFSNPDLDFKRFQEFETEFKKLNTPEIENVFGTLDLIAKRGKLLKRLKEATKQATNKTNVLTPLRLTKLMQGESDTEGWVTQLLEKRLRAQELDDWLRKITAEYQAKLQAILAIIEEEQQSLIDKQSKAEKEIRDVIGEEEAISGDLRNSAKNRYETAKANYEAYQKEQEKLSGLLQERDKILQELSAVQKAIFATRDQETEKIEQKVRLVEDSEFQLNLELRQLGDRRDFEETLRDGIHKPAFHGHWKSRKIAEILARNLTPQDCARAIFNKEPNKLVGSYENEAGTVFDLDKTYAQQFIQENAPYVELEGFDARQYDINRLETLLRLQETEVDDEFFIELGGKPIQHCSPGQRCSAMLPIVTLTSNAPLIIDQPEDNLDNRLVSKALFTILSTLKETRQMILATHNPNILVSGDAEQVLALDASGHLEEYGCIDKPSIVKAVISLMEGGNDAFERRERKYRPFIH